METVIGPAFALQALEASPDCITVLADDGRVLFINERGVELNEFISADDVVGRDFADLWPESGRSEVIAAIASAVSGELTRIEGFAPTAQGLARWWEVGFAPLTSDGGTRVVVISHDVTARYEALAARKQSELALVALNADLERQVVERAGATATTWQVSSHLLSVISLTDGTFLRVNPAWNITLGWSADEIVGQHYSVFVHPDDISASNAGFSTLVNAVPLPDFENRYRAKDGSWHWLRWVAVPEGDRLYSTATDVTEEKAQAETLRSIEDQLRQSQKLEAIGQLTGGVAHDFNNLLTVIKGSVDLLRRDNLTPEKRARYIDAIGTTADRASKLTGQLLAFARRQTLKPELFDAGVSLREVAPMVTTLTGSRIELDLQVPDQHYFILADRGQFDTAIVNMAINARDAMEGGGKLTIATGPVSGIPELRAHPPVPGDFVAVTITDTGKGIGEDDVAHIFEPFFTTKGVGEGTGLGLSQVFGFAKQSGGDIRAESRTGEGATFTLYLPRAYPDGEIEPTEDEEMVDGDGVCVLVVEDNSDVGAFATTALRELGYDSVLATDALHALAELERDCSRFHIVFSDVVMPGMSGLELGAEIKRRYPYVPVILTSGYSHVLAENGTHGFELLHKPYSIEQLSRVLSKTARSKNRSA